MSNAKQPAAAQPQRANGVQVQSSSYGKVIPVVYGRARRTGNLIDYFGFAAQRKYDQTNTGKGGGGNQQNYSYTYSVSFALALCEGPIGGIGKIWQDAGDTTVADVQCVTFDGARDQAAWAKPPAAHQINYPNIAYLGFPDFALGGSPNLPNFNFEVFGLLPYGNGVLDAEPSAIVNGMLTDPSYGLSFGYLGDLTLFQNYCIANGLFLSPEYDTEQAAADALDALLKLTNTAPVWSDGALKLIPYGDSELTANGVTYAPDFTSRYTLTVDDFIPGSEPTMKRAALDDLSNTVKLEWINAAAAYRQSTVEAKDQADVDARGVRNAQTVQAHAIKDPDIARKVAQLLLQRGLYIRNTWTFSLIPNYALLEPMDVVTLQFPDAGIDNMPVLITQIDDDENGLARDVTAVEFAAGVAEAALYASEPHAGSVVDTNAAPDATQVPIFVRAPQFLAPTPAVLIAAGGAGPNWGGCNVWISDDGASYEYLATLSAGARYGVLSAALAAGADPDVVNTLTVGLYEGELATATQQQADDFATLALVDHEVISYQTATLNANGEYELIYLRRGGYGTAIADHAAGAPFMRLDTGIAQFSIDPGNVGKIVYIKLTAFNIYGAAEQSLADVAAYQYTIGSGEEVPDVPPVPVGFKPLAIADGVNLVWETPNPNAVLRTHVEYSTDDVNFELLALVGGATESWPHHFVDGSTFYYRARAESPSHQFSDYTPVVDSTGKLIEPGANVGIPAGQPVGGQFGAYVVADTADKLLKYVDPNNLAVALETVPFIHPNGTVYNASGTPTPFFDPDGGRLPCFLAFVGEDESRFAGAVNPDLIVVRRFFPSASGWQWNDGAQWHDYAVAFQDATIAQINVAATGEPVGVFPIAITNIVAATVATKEIPPGQSIDDPGTYKNNHTDQTVHQTVDGQQVGLNAGTTHLQTFVPKTGRVKQILVHETDGSFVRFGTADDSGWGALSRTYDQGHKPNLDNDVLEGVTYGRTLQSRLNSGKPLIDFSETFHLHKTQDYIADGATFRRVGSAYVDTANRINALFDPSVSIVYDGATLGDGIRRARSGLDSSGNVARTVPDGQVSESSVTQHQNAINAGNTQNVGSQPATAVQSTVQKSTRNVVTVGRVSGSGTTAGRVLLASKLK